MHTQLTHETVSTDGMGRRDFIKLGATGMVASLAGCAVPATVKTGLGESDAGESGAIAQAVVETSGKNRAPDVGDLAD